MTVIVLKKKTRNCCSSCIQHKLCCSSRIQYKLPCLIVLPRNVFYCFDSLNTVELSIPCLILIIPLVISNDHLGINLKVAALVKWVKDCCYRIILFFYSLAFPKCYGFCEIFVFHRLKFKVFHFWMV